MPGFGATHPRPDSITRDSYGQFIGAALDALGVDPGATAAEIGPQIAALRKPAVVV